MHSVTLENRNGYFCDIIIVDSSINIVDLVNGHHWWRLTVRSMHGRHFVSCGTV